jgi:tetratricopeptide (TPR) repeat protein
VASFPYAGYSESFLISATEANQIKTKLDAYEKGTLCIKELYESPFGMTDPCRGYIGYYLLHTNEVSVKQKLVFSRCYIEFCMFPEAAKLAEEYLSVYSNNISGLEILGYSYAGLIYNGSNNWDRAIQVYSRAVKLGDKDSYEPLAGLALKDNQLDVIEKIIPQLLSLSKSTNTPDVNKINIITILIGYSMKADQKDVFIKTLEGINMEKILQDNDVKLDVTKGCVFFEDEDTNKDIEKIRQEMETATSSTNSVSSPPR